MIPIKPEDREWLVPELYRRAARCYEKAGMWKEAQRCWQKAGDPAHTAPLLLAEKRYAAGLEMYRAWLAGLAPGDGMGEVQARLGVAACLKGMQRDPEAQGEYRIARNLVEQRAGGDPAIAAGCWEALGAYGARVGRSDLVQVGYEQALELYERERSSEWVRVAQEYRVAVSVNRLLVADIDRRLSNLTAQIVIERQVVRVSADQRFQVFVDNVIRDTRTGLDWFVGPDQDTTWDRARDWVSSLTVAGGNWRMPTVEELRGIYQQGKGSRNMDPVFQTTGWWVWSGELVNRNGNPSTNGNPPSARYFSFSHGNDGWGGRSGDANFRGFAVR